MDETLDWHATLHRGQRVTSVRPLQGAAALRANGDASPHGFIAQELGLDWGFPRAFGLSKRTFLPLNRASPAGQIWQGSDPTPAACRNRRSAEVVSRLRSFA
jgi:hypothetical protein